MAKTTSRRKALRPRTLRIRSYQVGFGDCFLLTFGYADKTRRHILIDFGSTGVPRSAPAGVMTLIAKDIKTECREGKDDLVVVATHRHKDHISGFATNENRTGTGDIIRSLAPKLVIQPWTEAPDAEPYPTSNPDEKDDRKAFMAALESMHVVADRVRLEAATKDRRYPSALVSELEFLGDDNLKNLSAVKNLADMGGSNEYLHFGSKTSLSRYIPGVEAMILGPPTLRQSRGILKERARDEAEYWHLQAIAGQTAGVPTSERKELFPGAKTMKAAPPAARWFQHRLRRVRGEQLLSLVRSLDKAMNNTSLILLLTVGKKRFLFPGDAQIENWQYALSQAPNAKEIRDLLAAVDVYKVGHHGSLNATPKSLWRLFEKKGSGHKADRLKTLLSTMSGKHGRRANRTEVPRTTLLEELETSSELTSTATLRSKETWFHDVTVHF